MSARESVHPEVILLGDHALSCITWTLDKEVERLEGLLAEQPDLQMKMAENGWTTRALALGHLFSGLLDLADFDDEKGRT